MNKNLSKTEKKRLPGKGGEGEEKTSRQKKKKNAKGGGGKTQQKGRNCFAWDKKKLPKKGDQKGAPGSQEKCNVARNKHKAV